MKPRRRNVPWDTLKLELLEDPESAVEYIQAFLEEGDPIQACLADVIKAQGLSKMAQRTGIAAPNLLRATRKGANPTVATLSAILEALGMELSVRTKASGPSRHRPSA